MSRRVLIQPAVLRDASYVLANLRPLDYIEMSCQVPAGTRLAEIAYNLLTCSDAWTAHYDGQPVAVFGTAPISAACVSLWALGTPRMRRAAPAITDHVLDELMPRLLTDGIVSAEARSIIAHNEAHHWMRACGATMQGQAFPYGRNRELFLLFRWTEQSIERIKRRPRSHSHAR